MLPHASLLPLALNLGRQFTLSTNHAVNVPEIVNWYRQFPRLKSEEGKVVISIVRLQANPGSAFSIVPEENYCCRRRELLE